MLHDPSSWWLLTCTAFSVSVVVSAWLVVAVDDMVGLRRLAMGGDWPLCPVGAHCAMAVAGLASSRFHFSHLARARATNPELMDDSTSACGSTLHA